VIGPLFFLTYLFRSPRSSFFLNWPVSEGVSILRSQQSPCAFETFCIIFKGKILSHHPISNTRFENIMK